MDGIPLDESYTWAEARALGVTRRQISSDGVRLNRGLYVSRSAALDLPTRCRAWRRVLPADAAFGLHTASALYGCAASRAEDVHVVLTPRHVLPQHAGLRVHTRTLEDQDTSEIEGLAVTSGAQTFLDLAAALRPPALLALGDALARAGHLDLGALEDRLTRAARVRGVVRARRWAPYVDGRAASPRESELRYWLLASDLPDPQLQIPIRDRRGREVAHADLGYEQWKVALEYEGRQHAEHEQFDRDIDRYSLMSADGWLTLRFANRHLGRAGVVVDRTRRALQQRGWTPGPG
ncbi:DUF559 domain-containing protein [Blastococcus brunescens]|uniref:DUF559 domain-containing protein n=1 Tax=Blastococcus brunescens TaxID=1564165 RepID=A0ABZ1B623_9ACTN|nr:DUF559 domain-containing protein [Blastococcus sp. BMG 8361]WRL66194.1 DUF559 domain-containing protein [Blastococcus sp. BMG 8361]